MHRAATRGLPFAPSAGMDPCTMTATAQSCDVVGAHVCLPNIKTFTGLGAR